MRLANLKYKRSLPHHAKDPFADISISQTAFSQFNSTMLGLGALNTHSKQISCLAAIFDLEGFTTFTSQSDPNLAVPAFLDDFISWLFSTLGEQSTERRGKGRVYLWCPLPFFAKFMGDGVLYLWEIDYDGINNFCSRNQRNERFEVQGDVANIISVIYDVCKLYPKGLYPKLARSYTKAPKRLRCGVALGQVFSVGNALDYVGPCINMAARLQKLSKLGLCVRQKGVQIHLSPAEELKRRFVLKTADIRGAGQENIYVVRKEFAALPKSQKRLFSNP